MLCRWKWYLFPCSFGHLENATYFSIAIIFFLGNINVSPSFSSLATPTVIQSRKRTMKIASSNQLWRPSKNTSRPFSFVWKSLDKNLKIFKEILNVYSLDDFMLVSLEVEGANRSSSTSN